MSGVTSSVCCSVLQCVAVCCSVLQCVAVCCSVCDQLSCVLYQSVAVCCSVLQCVAVCCSVLQCVVMCCSVLQCVAVCCFQSVSSTFVTCTKKIATQKTVTQNCAFVFFTETLHKLLTSDFSKKA